MILIELDLESKRISVHKMVFDLPGLDISLCDDYTSIHLSLYDQVIKLYEMHSLEKATEFDMLFRSIEAIEKEQLSV